MPNASPAAQTDADLDFIERRARGEELAGIIAEASERYEASPPAPRGSEPPAWLTLVDLVFRASREDIATDVIFGLVGELAIAKLPPKQDDVCFDCRIVSAIAENERPLNVGEVAAALYLDVEEVKPMLRGLTEKGDLVAVAAWEFAGEAVSYSLPSVALPA